MRSSKLVFFSSSFSFDIFFYSCYTISGFPRCPCVLPDIEFLPNPIFVGKLLNSDHVFGRHDVWYHSSDGVVGSLVFLLGIPELVDAIRDYLEFDMVTLHLVLQCEDIEGMFPITRCLELNEKLPLSNYGAVGIVPLDFAEPYVFNNDED